MHRTTKILWGLLFQLVAWCLGGMFVLMPVLVSAEEIIADHPILYLFWGDGCPHCEEEKEFLEQLREQYPELEMRWFEVWNYEGNRELAEAMRKAYDVQSSSVPMTFLGRWTITGYRDAHTTGKQIENQIISCIQQGCIDALSMLGPNRIVLDIREQLRQDVPTEWERFPATDLPTSLSATQPSTGSPPPDPDLVQNPSPSSTPPRPRSSRPSTANTNG